MLRRLAPGPILAALIASRPYIPNMRRILSTVTRRGPGRGVGDGSVPIRASISDQNGVHPLLVLATPLGNPEDISLRARRALSEADVIYCEDTRVSQGLMQAVYQSDNDRPSAKLRSLHSHNEGHRIEEVLEAVKSGQRVALISDAGTPGISDPGARVVEAAHQWGLKVSPIPGPSAVSTLLSVSGMPSKHIFLGFLPRGRGQRVARLKQGLRPGYTLVVFSPMRDVIELLEDLRDIAPTALVTLGRELTKKYEEVKRLPVIALIDSLNNRPEEEKRGEASLCVCLPGATGKDGDSEETAQSNSLDLEAMERIAKAAQKMLLSGMSRRDTTEVLSGLDLGSKRELMKIVLEASEALTDEATGDGANRRDKQRRKRKEGKR
ncbi:hypothetical protein AAMO2058_001016300 [Amorphochlora amoebiformis]